MADTAVLYIDFHLLVTERARIIGECFQLRVRLGRR
jgi:hypothetical protein